MIARTVGVSQAGISKVIRINRETGSTAQRPRSGRPLPDRIGFCYVCVGIPEEGQVGAFEESQKIR